MLVDRKCRQCGGDFKARSADVRRGWALFCSKSCKAIKQEKKTGQYKAYLNSREEKDDYDHCGHIFDSGFFGHGQS